MKSAVEDIRPFNMSGDERLIELVRNHKILYNKTCHGIKGMQLKQEAWKIIADQLGSTELECSRRWKTIRERYSREVRQRETDPEDKGPNAVEWHLLKSLTFLRKYIIPRGPRTRSPNEFGFVDTIMQNQRLSTEDSYISDSCYSFYEEAIAPKEELTTAKEEVMSPTGVTTTRAEELPRETATTSSELMTPSRPSNALQMFGQTVAAFLSEMSEAKQAKAMRLLFDTLITIKMEPEES